MYSKAIDLILKAIKNTEDPKPIKAVSRLLEKLNSEDLYLIKYGEIHENLANHLIS